VERIRIGVIGLGLVAQVAHLPNLLRLSRSFAVTHVSDLSDALMETVAAGLPGTPRTSRDWRALCDDPELDALLLLTPGAHGPVAAAALSAGKHVLSEKPLCITQQEARDLDELAREQGRVLQVAYMKAYDPAIATARECLPQIGPVQLVTVEVRHPTHQSQLSHLDVVPATDVDPAALQAARTEAVAATRDALGDAPPGIARLYREVLLGSVVHELSALRSLGFAVPTHYQHVVAWPFDPQRDDADHPSLAATATLADGILLRLQWLWLPEYPRYEETITVIGTRGAVHLDMPQPYGPNVSARLHVRDPDGRWAELFDGRHRRDSGFLEELRAFHAAVTRGAPVATAAETARQDTASLQAFAVALAAGYGARLGGEAEVLTL
jgi:predicted dehydrogenase